MTTGTDMFEPYLQKLYDVDNIEAAFDLLQTYCQTIAGFQLVGTHYEYNGYLIFTGLTRDMARFDRLRRVLQQFKTLQCAPVIMRQTDIDGHHQLVVMSYPGAEDQPLIPFLSYSVKLSEKARQQFIQEISLLADKQWVNCFASRSPRYWFVHPKTDAIVLKGWESLEKVSAQEAQQALVAFNKLLDGLCS